jgi:hypothetical protein
MFSKTEWLIYVHVQRFTLAEPLCPSLEYIHTSTSKDLNPSRDSYVASFFAIDMQDSRKHPREKQIPGIVWVFHGDITTAKLLDDSDSSGGQRGCFENEGLYSNLLPPPPPRAGPSYPGALGRVISVIKSQYHSLELHAILLQPHKPHMRAWS